MCVFSPLNFIPKWRNVPPASLFCNLSCCVLNAWPADVGHRVGNHHFGLTTKDFPTFPPTIVNFCLRPQIAKYKGVLSHVNSTYCSVLLPEFHINWGKHPMWIFEIVITTVVVPVVCLCLFVLVYWCSLEWLLNVQFEVKNETLMVCLGRWSVFVGAWASLRGRGPQSQRLSPGWCLNQMARASNWAPKQKQGL